MTTLVEPKPTLTRIAARCRGRGIVIPTFENMKDPETVPSSIREKLRSVGLWDLHPMNLFRITWKNEPVAAGGGFGKVNTLILPPELTGVKARIVALVGKWFPTGAHKVGATFGCLVPRLISGQFDPGAHKAAWPSTGNFCRGGAYVSSLLGCDSIAILPEGMSRERFDWLKKIAGEIITTPGGESNVKEIFDKCRGFKLTRPEAVIFNQFEEFGNYLWHYEVTGNAMREALAPEMKGGRRLAGVVLSAGSGGTLAAADFLKNQFPAIKIAAAEALECPTLLQNGFGDHAIEGIGDKHVTWIHNVRNTDMIVGIDGRDTYRLMRLFNEEAGKGYLAGQGVDTKTLGTLPLLGLSSLCNLMAAIKFAKYYELTEKDCVFTVFTDSMEMYQSRLKEARGRSGEYRESMAARDYERLASLSADPVEELSYNDRKRIHNLKYFTWVEQQGKSVEELNAQWYDDGYWQKIQSGAARIDDQIREFNALSGFADG